MLELNKLLANFCRHFFAVHSEREAVKGKAEHCQTAAARPNCFTSSGEWHGEFYMLGKEVILRHGFNRVRTFAIDMDLSQVVLWLQ